MTKQRTPATASGSGSSSAGREREAAAKRERRGGDKSANQDELPLPTGRNLRLPARRTAIERLVTGMRVDVGADARGGCSSEDNQQVVDDYADVSLELLALLSPHGTTQQWEVEDAYDGCLETKDGEAEQHAKRLSMLARVDLSEYSGDHNKTTRYDPPDLTSPTQHMVPFQASPTHSAHGNELDLASPVALPDSPESQQPLWQNDEFTLSDDASVLGGTHGTAKDPAGTAQDAPRSSPSTIARRGAPPSTRRSPQPPHGSLRTPMKPTSAVSETKPKARHGGIYSLLLKNKAPEHEPVLVDEKRSPLGPEVSPSLSSISKRTSPPSFAKIQHGGIYGLLRRNSKGGE